MFFGETTALRSQKTARAEATNNALRSQTTSVAGDAEFFSLYGVELGGTRPDRLYEVRSQERVQRRTVEQNVYNTLFLPSLDVPVPQMDNQLVEVCRQLDVRIPELAIEVPKISSSRQSRRRRVRFAEQTADQLVEVPTIVSYSSLHGLVEQNVDIPVPHGRDRVSGLLGLHLGQDSTAFGRADLRFHAATAEHFVDIQVPRGGRDLPSAASSSGLLGTANQGVFCTFPQGKQSAQSGPHPGSELGEDFTSSTPSAYEVPHFSEDGNFYYEDDKKTWMRLPSGRWYLLCSEPEEHRDDPGVPG